MASITKTRRRNRQGFTLIELIIVVAVIGIIAAILIPNLLDSLQKTKQKRTMADMRDLGAAWMSWLTDQASAAAAGASTKTYNFTALSETLTADELMNTLYISPNMFYTRNVPSRDGWARPFDYRWSGDPSKATVIGIRSYARDGAEGPNGSGGDYPMGPFLTSDYDQDIVWADGYFVTYPNGASTN